MQKQEGPNAAQILAALQGRTIAEAARALGISERTLYRRMDAFGIKTHRVRIQDAA